MSFDPIFAVIHPPLTGALYGLGARLDFSNAADFMEELGKQDERKAVGGDAVADVEDSDAPRPGIGLFEAHTASMSCE